MIIISISFASNHGPFDEKVTENYSQSKPLMLVLRNTFFEKQFFGLSNLLSVIVVLHQNIYKFGTTNSDKFEIKNP